MAFNLSPSVDWAEQDYSLVATTQADTIGGYAGHFRWGQADTPVLITGGEDDLVKQFYKPNNDVYLDFFIAKDFLSYSNKMWVVRGVGPDARNAFPAGTSPQLVKNDDEWENAISLHTTPVLGKYPGDLANGLALITLDHTTFADSEYAKLFDFEPANGEFNFVVADTLGTHVGLGAKGQRERFVINPVALDGTPTGISITDGSSSASIDVTSASEAETIADNLAAEFNTVFSSETFTATKVDLGGGAFAVDVTHTNFDANTPLVAAATNSAKLDITSSVVQTPSYGSALEIYSQLVGDVSGKKPSGESAHFATSINRKSSWIRIGSRSTPAAGAVVLEGGVLDEPTSLVAQYDLLGDSEQYDVNFIVSGAHGVTVQQKVSDVCGSRRDCMGFYSPPMSAVVNNAGSEREDILHWRKTDWNKASSYDIIDCNWGQIYDQYNDEYRWIPCCGGTAGLVARTWYTDAPWVSPAFHQRGRYKNYRRLAWSPKKSMRDELYKAQVNPIINMAGEGRLLYGDKTGTPKDSAFNRINVRGMFIVVEKTIANLAKYYLGEVNDEFTRTQFLNVLNPYLRSVKTRRGMEDFRVVCDVRNNDGQVRASNELRADIWIKPLYSINFIKLNFAAVRPDISFDELEGQLLG